MVVMVFKAKISRIIKLSKKYIKKQRLVKIKKMVELERVPTGIVGFDKLINGGLVRQSVNLISGGPGSGKTIFAMQFIINGIRFYNEPGVYVALEESKEKVYRYMSVFGWDLEKLEKEGKFAFLECTPEEIKKILEEGGGLIESAIERIKAKRLVIDPLSTFVLLHGDELAEREDCLALFNMINKWDCTTILTSDHEADMNLEYKIDLPIEFEVEGLILLHNFKKRAEMQRAIEISKMRGTDHAKDIIPYKITDKGKDFLTALYPGIEVLINWDKRANPREYIQASKS